MTHLLRIQYENAYYHVTCGGNAGKEIFANEQDRSVFLEILNGSREIGEMMGVDYSSVSAARKGLRLLVQREKKSFGVDGKGAR
jgi:hypothetical protein